MPDRIHTSPPARSQTVLLSLGGIALTCLLALTAIVIIRSMSRSLGSAAAAQSSADAFLRLMEKHDFHRAYRSMSSAGQARGSEVRLRALVQAIELRQGRIEGYAPSPGFSIHWANGMATANVHRSVHFERGQKRADIALTDERGEWRVLSFRVEY